MRLRYLFILCLLLAASGMLAQVPSHLAPDSDARQSKPLPPRLYSVRLAAGAFYIPKTSDPGHGITQLGIRVGRLVSGRLRIEAGYAEWHAPFASHLGDNHKTVYESASPHVSSDYKGREGQLEGRISYRMLDLNLLTPLLRISDRHLIEAGLAASYCWGLNAHLQFYHVYSPGLVATAYYTKPAQYLGLCPNLRYSYQLCKNRFSLGAEYMLRWYPERVKSQHDFSVLAGGNF